MILKNKSELLRDYRELGIAYGVAFDPKGQFTDLVRKDLAQFCRASKSLMVPSGQGVADPIMMAYLAGRRDVWLRIEEFLTLKPEEILALNTKPLEE